MANMEKLVKVFEDEQIVAAINACTTKEEVMAVLKEKGVEITEEELKKLLAVAIKAKKEKLDLDELDAVAGGTYEEYDDDDDDDYTDDDLIEDFNDAKKWVKDTVTEGASWLLTKVWGLFH